MLACESSVDRLSKVLYLGERGADCLAKDLVGFDDGYKVGNHIVVLLYRMGRRHCFMLPLTQYVKRT